MPTKRTVAKKDSTANLGFEADFGPPAPAGRNTFRRDLCTDSVLSD